MGKNSDCNNLQNNHSPAKTSTWQALALILGAVIIFFGLLEGGLALLDVDPILKKDDPFVGFAGNVPLFEESLAPNGKKIYSTAKNKLNWFNRQMFLEEKAADTYRIFCLGGSTTYGRPYNGSTAFAGWLRELLPAADRRRDWEVINVGGISYASYRVARLMEELVQYQPDLFIIYTGQNEFLEERTYGGMREVPELVRDSIGILAQTRTWAAMNTVLGRIGLVPEQNQPQKVKLAAEVDTILDHSTGPKDYQRDNSLKTGVLEHYRVSLERMADTAKRTGARVIFVTPASNLKDCSPFKSDHSDALSAGQRQQSEGLLKSARNAQQQKDWQGGLKLLDQAIAIDPQCADLHYYRGQSLFELGRYQDALSAFKRARDEDVCPLRALTPMRDIVASVAREKGTGLIDYVGLLEDYMQTQKGHRILGEELFLDHVHPTVFGHQLLAVSLVDKLREIGIVDSPQNWRESVVPVVAARIKSRLTPHLQAKGLINLAKVLHWAGKMDEAQRLATQGLAAAKGDPQLTSLASNVLIKLAKQQGDQEKKQQYINNALQVDPWSPMMHYHLGVSLLQQEQRKKGAAHVLFSTAFWDTNQTNSVLGLILYNNGHLELAYRLLQKALQQTPSDQISRQAFMELTNQLGQHAVKLPTTDVKVTRYANGAPHEIYLRWTSGPLANQPDGIFTEWHANGALKRYTEYFKGLAHGIELHWDQNGQLEKRIEYNRGTATNG